MPSTINTKALVAVRKHYLLTQSDLAVMADSSLSTIQKIENGTHTNVTLETLASIGKALHVDYRIFLNPCTYDVSNTTTAEQLPCWS